MERVRDMVQVLRQLDLEEVLDELGIDVEDKVGADAYARCPDPDHADGKPSFHVCVDDVRGSDGKSRLGLYNCWSHPPPGLSGGFVNLVARCLTGAWDRDVTAEELDAARRWLVERVSSDAKLRSRPRVKRAAESSAPSEIPWPLTLEVAEVAEVARYLARRGITAERARRLGIRAVVRSGPELERCLGRTLPGALFPIGERAWYVRSASPTTESKFKGRYPPGARLQSAGALWSEGEPSPGPVVLVEGIFDAERVARLAASYAIGVAPSNVMSALGGNLTEAQARKVRTISAGCGVRALGDGDDGGLRFVESARSKIGDQVVMLRTPMGTDPGDAPEHVIRELLMGEEPAAEASKLVTPEMRRRRNARHRLQKASEARVRDAGRDS